MGRSTHWRNCYERQEEVGPEHRREGVQFTLGRRTSRHEGDPQRAKARALGWGGRGKRRTREDRRDVGTRSRHRQAAPCRDQSQRADALTENLVRDACICKNGKVVCFFQSGQKFKSRYATFGFQDAANLDDGDIWPTSFALKRLTAAVEEKIGKLVKRAAS